MKTHEGQNGREYQIRYHPVDESGQEEKRYKEVRFEEITESGAVFKLGNLIEVDSIPSSSGEVLTVRIKNKTLGLTTYGRVLKK